MSINDATILTKVKARRKIENHFFNLSLNNKGAPGQGHRCNSKFSSFFFFAGQKHISDKRRASNEQVQH